MANYNILFQMEVTFMSYKKVFTVVNKEIYYIELNLWKDKVGDSGQPGSK